MICFNISASSYGLFKKSPLIFYFQYILKSKPDTRVITVYGEAGKLVHSLLNKYNDDDSIDIMSLFEEKWVEKKLHVKNGFNNRPLNNHVFKNSLEKGKSLINNVYDNIIMSEEKIELPFVEDDKVSIKLKGFIDFVAEKDENIIIGDWKTNSSVGDFTNHAKMYALLYWKKYKVFPKKLVYEYLKINETITYNFTKEEIMIFEEELKNFVKKIKERGKNIKRYELGDINFAFNCHKKKCLEEKYDRKL